MLGYYYLNGNDGDDELYGDVSDTSTYGNDTLVGGNGADYLSGDGGKDILLGGADNDTLFGGNGDDTLDGGSGFDQLIGGIGDDHYIIKKGENFSVNSTKGTLHNDYDPGDDSLSTILIDPPLHGELKFNNDGSFKYIPEDYFVVADTFHYAVTDGHFYDTAEVTLARLITGVDIATIIEIEPIYFDLNKSNIRDDAAKELDKIVDVVEAIIASIGTFSEINVRACFFASIVSGLSLIHI